MREHDALRQLPRTDMASIHRDIVIAAPARQVWAAMEDVGALHTRLVPGFVTACRLEGETRHLVFANGAEASERIVSVDAERMRVAWTATSHRLEHHNASAQVIALDDASCRVVWIADLLPHALAPAIAGMIEAALAAMQRAAAARTTMETSPGA